MKCYIVKFKDEDDMSEVVDTLWVKYEGAFERMAELKSKNFAAWIDEYGLEDDDEN